MYAAETPEKQSRGYAKAGPFQCIVPKICKDNTARASDMPKTQLLSTAASRQSEALVYARQLAICEVGGRWMRRWVDFEARQNATSVICAKQIGRGNWMPKSARIQDERAS